MHTAFTRANVVFFFALTTLFACGLGCALSYYTETTPAAAALTDVSITNVHVQYPKPFRGAQRGMEYALVEFDLKADLRKLWNWNVSRPTNASVLQDRARHSACDADSYLLDSVLPCVHAVLQAKQMLVSVVAHFSTPSHPLNSQVVWNRIINATDAEAFNLKEQVSWEMSQPLHEYYARGREVTLLSAMRGDLHGMASNGGPPSNRTIELRLQYEIFPLIGSTFLGQVASNNTRFEIDSKQPLYWRQQ
jgi:hypothetical protein